MHAQFWLQTFSYSCKCNGLCRRQENRKFFSVSYTDLFFQLIPLCSSRQKSSNTTASGFSTKRIGLLRKSLFWYYIFFIILTLLSSKVNLGILPQEFLSQISWNEENQMFVCYLNSDKSVKQLWWQTAQFLWKTNEHTVLNQEASLFCCSKDLDYPAEVLICVATDLFPFYSLALLAQLFLKRGCFFFSFVCSVILWDYFFLNKLFYISRRKCVAEKKLVSQRWKIVRRIYVLSLFY